MALVRVKICGVTRPGDALLAASLGADAIGLNFWPGSKRFVEPARAREIVRALPPLVTAVGVFVNATRDEILAAAAESGVGAVQLHGDEPDALADALPLPVIRAIRVEGPAAIARARALRCAVLLDAPAPGYGGGGATFDWELAREVAAARPVLLAGGLTPDNVRLAVRTVRPWGVDVASGVESSPGIKDPEKLARFIRAAKETTT